MHLGASTRTIHCSGGQYASFGTPHAYLKTKFQNLKFSKNQKRARPFRHVYQCLKFCQFVIMITKHHIHLIQVSNSLDLKMTTGPLWGPRVYTQYYTIIAILERGRYKIHIFFWTSFYTKYILNMLIVVLIS